MNLFNKIRGRLSVVAMVLTLSVGLFYGCNDQSASLTAPGTTASVAQDVLSLKNPQIQKVIAIQDKYNQKLLGTPGVAGTATGITSSGNVVVRVYLEHAQVRGIPATLDKVPVDAVVTGMFVPYADPTSRFDRPVPIGVSSGHPDITAGTIGARVKDAQGNVYALSNNHVYADVNNAKIGDDILQPGAYDGGTAPADVIGALYDYEPIQLNGPNNTMDAALASTTINEVGYATPANDGYGAPASQVKAANVGMNVQKYGRTTGHTFGEVSEVNVTVNVCYETAGPFQCKSYATFVDQIGIKGKNGTNFSSGGDSGSLIVTDDTDNNPIGLLFAGSDTRTLANPIQVVLDRFNVTIDDGSGETTDPTNNPPTADFTYSVTDLTVDFTDQSTDSDGTIAAWSWGFGDGSTSTAQNPSHTYGADGTYTVTLTVTDNDGATDQTSQDVTVTTTTGSDIVLSANGYKVRGRHTVELTWTGATTAVDIYRDGDVIAFGVSGDSYTDSTGNVGGATYVYSVCETGATTTCSNEVTVTF